MAPKMVQPGADYLPAVKNKFMRTIIAPTDFSPVSINAVNYAADMACMLRANLTLFHVYPIPQPVSEVPITEYSIEQMESDAKRKINALKEDLLDRTGERIIIHNELRAGDVLSNLTGYCAEVMPYAVVMGAESLGGLERFILGGKTTGAVERLESPLFIVPATAKFKRIAKIGLACDLKKVIETVRAREIRELVNEFEAELHVLNIRENFQDTVSAEAAEESDWLKAMLGELHPKYHFINDPDMEHGIVEFAKKKKLDLLIVIPKKHKLLSKLFHPSHSLRLVLHTQVPVISLHE